jgi:hypothetical protein
MDTGAFSTRKRPGREADHSPPSSAKIKNGGIWNNEDCSVDYAVRTYTFLLPLQFLPVYVNKSWYQAST